MNSVPALIGTYTHPAVEIGQEVQCLYRKARCRISSYSDSPIWWPRCQPLGQRGGNGLYVDETLRQAILTESADALMYWFGVSSKVVWRWRKAFGVTKFGTEGSKLLHDAGSEKGAAEVRGKKLDLSDKNRNRRAKHGRKMVKRLCESNRGLNPHQRPWTLEELALLGTMPDKELAAKLGRSSQAVRRKRNQLEIDPPERKPWTPEEDAILFDGTAKEVAERLGRSVSAVEARRFVTRPTG